MQMMFMVFSIGFNIKALPSINKSIQMSAAPKDCISTKKIKINLYSLLLQKLL